MAQFLVELYAPRHERAVMERFGTEARRAARELAAGGRTVRLVRSIYVPDEETCFQLYEADSVELVREAATRAALPFDRVSEAVSDA